MSQCFLYKILLELGVPTISLVHQMLYFTDTAKEKQIIMFVSAMEQRAAERVRLKQEREEKRRKMEEEKLVSLLE